MDKLRAIQFFNHSVQRGSFAAAARALEVSTPAVSQLVGALERSLGTALVHRTARGLTLTPDGERYYEISRKVAADLMDIEQHLGPIGTKPRGTLTVGMRHGIGQNCVMPRIARFLVRYPDVELITKPVLIEDFDRGTLDLAVMVGWPPKRDLIARTLAQTRHVVCAAPEYWKRSGRPTDPDALRDHHCLVFRNDEGVLVDRWTFAKAGEQRVVNVKSRLLSDDRSWLDTAAVAGAGVIRLTDLTAGPYLSSGLLVPALTDWESVEAPTIYALYRKNQRQSKMVQAFLDFLMEVFAELEQERTPAPTRAVARVRQPDWFGRTQGRQSTHAARRR
jgi:DNA-binding transcriptional LysR family regulator